MKKILLLISSFFITANASCDMSMDENINKNLFILGSYIKLFYENYTLVFATIYQLIT